MKQKIILRLLFLSYFLIFHFFDVFAFQDDIISLPKNPKSELSDHLFPRYLNLEPRVGLVLSGGGSRGIAHIGVLKVLAENEIPIHYIVGTSMGSVVGGLFASGYSVDEIWQSLSNILWQEIITDQPQRTSQLLSKKQTGGRQFLQVRFNGFKPYIPPAISPGQRVYSQLSQLVLNAPFHESNDYNKLKIPFRSAATDLISGKSIHFNHGDLALVMLASSAIPLLFSPVSIDSLLLVDGGVLTNIPIESIYEFNPDLIITVDTTSPLRPKEEILLPWQLADQVTTIMQVNQKETALQNSDIVITPDLTNRTNSDFDSLETIYQAGIEAAQPSIAKIKSKISTVTNWNGNLETNYIISNVKSNQSLAVKRNGVLIEPGSVVNEKEIITLFQNLYWSGSVDSVYAIVHESEQTHHRALDIVIKNYPSLKKINLHHNHQVSDSLLFSVIYNKIGDPFNIHTWQRDRENILKLYRQNDFSLAKIYKEILDSSSGILDIYIDEGRIEKIEVSGNARTRPSIILNEYRLKSGDYFRNSLSQEGVTNIYGMGLFDRVQPEYNWQSQKLHMNLRVWEKPSTLVNLSYNYNKEYRFQSLFQWIDDNIFGLGNQIGLSGIAGGRRFGADFRIQFDRILNSEFSSLFLGYYWQKKFNTFSSGNIVGEYKERRYGLRFSLGRQLKRAGLISTEFVTEKVRLVPVFGFGFPNHEENRISLKLQWVVDSLDKLPFPTSGRYNVFYYEASPEFLGNKKSYFKLYSRFESYYPLGKRWTISQKIVWATAENTTPFSEFFDLGNTDSFYGFRLNEMRGRRMLRGNLELRYLMPGKVPVDTYFSFRYDIGAIWRNSADQIVGDDFINGLGGSISFESILGVFSFRYGKNSNDRSEYSFDLGFQF